MLPEPLRPAAALTLLTALALGLGACSTTPPSPVPAMAVPPAFKEAALFVPANPAAAEVPDAWWTVFNDPVLNDLQAQLLRDNLSLQSAAAAVATAQAALGSSQVALRPTVNVTGGVSRAAGSSSGSNGTTYTAQGSLASWEIDLWNRVGAGVDAAGARVQASRDTLAATRLSAQATLTQTYFSLRQSQGLQVLLGRSVQAYAQSLTLVQHRHGAGMATAADVAQAQTQVYTATAQLAEAQLQAAQLQHALAGLLGRAPAAFDLPAWPQSHTQADALPEPPALPVQLPATLLERRPDIAAAERQVAAANAQLGVAKAAFFPALTLSVSGGVRHNGLADLFQAGNRFWSLGPTLALAAFDGGARTAAQDAATATRDQAVVTYRQTVLTALQEVEDNLAAAAYLDQEVQAQQQALAAARRSLAVVQAQYQAGTVSYLNVVTAQTTALSAETSLLATRNRRLSATTTLLKNLAGRWS
jgi:NodT family efflux transporter outer membrane factor (OMF) lipoprotein